MEGKEAKTNICTVLNPNQDLKCALVAQRLCIQLPCLTNSGIIGYCFPQFSQSDESINEQRCKVNQQMHFETQNPDCHWSPQSTPRQILAGIIFV